MKGDGIPLTPPSVLYYCVRTYLPELVRDVGDAFEERARELGRAGVPPQVARSHLIEVEYLIDGGAQAHGHVRQVAVIEHHGGCQQQRGGIGDSLAGNVRGGAMHGFEYRRIGANIGTRRHSQAAHQARDQVGQNVAEQIGGHQHVELPWVQHQLHRAGIYDDRVEDEPALVLSFVEFQSRLQKDAGQHLHDVGLVHDGHLLAACCNGMVEREFQETAAALARVHARGHGDGVRVVVDLNVVLMSNVQALQVLAHDHQIDFVET